MKTTPELLAPAGNLDAAITAFENGADAVYAGLGKFNARERTEKLHIRRLRQANGLCQQARQKGLFNL